MNREELKAAVKKAYGKGYHEGFADACDIIAPALIGAVTSIVTKLKERAQKSEAEVIDELES